MRLTSRCCSLVSCPWFLVALGIILYPGLVQATSAGWPPASGTPPSKSGELARGESVPPPRPGSPKPEVDGNGSGGSDKELRDQLKELTEALRTLRSELARQASPPDMPTRAMGMLGLLLLLVVLMILYRGSRTLVRIDDRLSTLPSQLQRLSPSPSSTRVSSTENELFGANSHILRHLRELVAAVRELHPAKGGVATDARLSATAGRVSSSGGDHRASTARTGPQGFAAPSAPSNISHPLALEPTPQPAWTNEAVALAVAEVWNQWWPFQETARYGTPSMEDLSARLVKRLGFAATIVQLSEDQNTACIISFQERNFGPFVIPLRREPNQIIYDYFRFNAGATSIHGLDRPAVLDSGTGRLKEQGEVSG